MAPVDAIVVNFNAGAYLAACVASLKHDGVRRVLVVDNASTDDSVAVLAAEHPDVDVVAVGSNRGFGTAANLGVGRLDSQYVLVMNPDTVVAPGATQAMVAALDRDARLSAVGPRIDNPDGTRYPSARAFPSMVDAIGHGFLGLVRPDNRFTRAYRRDDADPDSATEVDWVSGACLLVRRSAFDLVGGFDESYFMYVEDVDLCWRMRQAGWWVAYEPAARVTHEVGVSTRQTPYRMIAHHHRSLMRFATRSASGPGRALLPAVAAGLVVRTGLACTRHALAALKHR